MDVPTTRALPVRCGLLQLGLVMVLLATSTPRPTSALRFHRQHMSVNILNALGDQPLTLRCQSRDDNLGVRTLQPTKWFGWGFEPNVLGTTLFWCDFVAGPRSQGFTVFQDIGLWGKQKRWCRQCIWVVQRDGFYRSENGVQAPAVKVHDWK